MNEEKRTAECGEEENISGGKNCTSAARDNEGEIKDLKAQDVNSREAPENGLSASEEETKRYFIN